MTLNKKALPEPLVEGELARLIPVGKDERKATSVFLATLSAVREFAKAIFSSVNIRIGSRTNIEVYTEVVFKDKSNKEKIRPDGLIIIDTGRNKWKALIESKTGKDELTEEQIINYVALAKKHKIDAVITLSNQYSAMPSHHPLHIRTPKSVDLFHFSWMYIQTEAILLLKTLGVDDRDQRFILNEMVRYFDHDSVGVSQFGSMNKEWKDLVVGIKNGSSLSKSSDEVNNTIISWHQEARDLCLIMTRELEVPVSLKLNRKHTQKPETRIKDDCEELVNDLTLSCKLDIPDAASVLEVTADLKGRIISCSMTLNAPKDKQRPSARLNWLLRQLKNTECEDIFIRACTKGPGINPQCSLNSARENPDLLLLHDSNSIQPVAFDIFLSRDLAGQFSSRTKFIQETEKAVQDFYKMAGENLKIWTPPAPKIKKNKPDNDVHEINEEETKELTSSVAS